MTTLTNPEFEIRWNSIRSAGDHIIADPFPDHDQDGIPSEHPNLWNVSFGNRVEDRNGNRFRLLGYGACQGDVVLRDRYGRQFYADGSMHMKDLGA